MAQMLEVQFIPQVADAIQELGYAVTREPSRIPKRSLWQDVPASLFRGLRYRPDLLVECDDKFLIVEVKTRPILLGGVMQAREYSKYFDAPVILCVPDSVFNETPPSVMSFASDSAVSICGISEIGDFIEKRLELG